MLRALPLPNRDGGHSCEYHRGRERAARDPSKTFSRSFVVAPAQLVIRHLEKSGDQLEERRAFDLASAETALTAHVRGERLDAAESRWERLARLAVYEQREQPILSTRRAKAVDLLVYPTRRGRTRRADHDQCARGREGIRDASA